jgi:YVTN family beta-propeller protein
MSPDGLSVYIANGVSVSQFDVGPDGKLSAKTPAAVLAGIGPVGIAVNPDGESVYVTNADGNDISQYDVGVGGALSPKSPATVNLAAGAFVPERVAVSPDGHSVYVGSLGTGLPSLQFLVSQFDVGPDGKLSAKSPAAVLAGEGPFGIAVNPDGQSVYVTNVGSDDVSQYDVGLSGVLSAKSPATVPAGSGPQGIAVSPPVPTSKEQCMNGGWRDFGVFKNQGACVSFVATGGKNPPAGG